MNTKWMKIGMWAVAIGAAINVAIGVYSFSTGCIIRGVLCVIWAFIGVMVVEAWRINIKLAKHELV